MQPARIGSVPILPGQAAPRILISRLSSIGDCVQTMPVLCALREAFPAAFIAWVTQSSCASLLRGHACLDALIVVEERWRRWPRALWNLCHRLRAMRFDIVIDPQGLSKSAIMGWLSGARCRLGFTRPQGREASLCLNNYRVRPTATHVVDRYLQLLGPLGIDSPKVRFGVPDEIEERSTVAAFLRQARLAGGFAVLNPGASWDSKLWPADRYGQVARHLGQRHALPSVAVWGTERECAWGEQISALSGGHALLAPATSLPELAGLLRRARLFVGSDTGPLHLAAAVGTTCVGLYGPTRPEACGPYGNGNFALQAFYQAGSRGRRRHAANRAMRAIGAAAVCQACDTILERQSTIGSAAYRLTAPDSE